MTKRATIYARISQADKKVAKVSNQIATCKAIAVENNWTVDPKHSFSDDGIAASGQAIDDTTLQNRPGALALLDLLRSGQVDVLIAVEGARLARTYLDGLQFIQASSEGKVTWHLDADGPLDPSTPMGEEVAVGIFASGRREGRVRNQRQMRRYIAERALGLPAWGVRPFGFQGRQTLTEEKATELGWEWTNPEEDDENKPQYFAIHPEEAPILREAIMNVTSGKETIWGVATRWTKEGVVTTTMGRERADRTRPGKTKITPSVWTASQVRQLLTRESNAGILMHKGAELPVSRIEPIISRAERDALLFAIAQKNIITPQKAGRKEKYLLSGIIECACGEKCYATSSYTQRKGGPRYTRSIYRCRVALTDRTQKHTSIGTVAADSFVVGTVGGVLIQGLLQPQNTSELEQGLRDLAKRATELTERLEHTAGILLDPALKLVHAAARQQLAAIEAERAQLEQEQNILLAQRGEEGALSEFIRIWTGKDPVEKMTELDDPRSNLEAAYTFKAAWADQPLEKRRDIIRATTSIRIRPGGRGVGRLEWDNLLRQRPDHAS